MNIMDFNVKKLAADAGTFLSRAVQFTEEKLGQAEKTEFDAHLENLLSKAECTKLWTEKIMRQTEVLLQPNPNARIEEFVYEKLDRKAPSRMNNPELLGQYMVDSGNEFGPGTAYGNALIKSGETQKRIGAADRELIQTAAINFLTPLRNFIEGDYKTITKERKLLQNKRLDLDAAKTRLKKAKAAEARAAVFLQSYSSTEGYEIVLLTDGEDSAVSSCFGTVQRSGSVIHTIALGPGAEKELDMLADMTGGLKFSATDSLDSNSLIDAFTGISSRDGNISQQAIQLESQSQRIKPMKWLNGIVSIDKTVGNDTYFVITWSDSIHPPGIFLTDPKGKKYYQRDFVIDNTNRHMARLKISGTAEAGDWIYQIQNTHTEGAQVISMTVTTRAASLTVPPVTVKSYLNQDTSNYPYPMIIYAEVSQGFLPVIAANVTATVEPVAGAAVELELYDTGSNADIFKNDGIYSRYFTSFNGNGRYNIKIRVQGKDKTARRVRRYSQALYVPGYVENGVIKMNTPRPEVSEDEIQPDIGSFSRIASGGSFVLAGAPPSSSSPPPDVFPPCQITDLEVQLEDDEFFLSWTAPGNDYDIGKVERYEIKMSKNPLELRDITFHTAISVNTSGLTTEFAGVKQSFQLKPENFTKENGTTIYFAIRGIDDSNNAGEASNIARTVVLVSTFPTTLPSTASSYTMASVTTTHFFLFLYVCYVVR